MSRRSSVLGKGIALQFKRRFPETFRAYAAACERGEIKPGRMFVVDTGQAVNPRYIVNFPTKRHWRAPSRLEDIRDGLAALVRELRERGIRSVAIPPLGCGNGGLEWADVEPMIREALADVPEVRAVVFAPTREATELSAPPQPARLTRGRALLIKLLQAYGVPGYRLGRLEVQKLCYFLQAAGEPMKLLYSKGRYGPHARNLDHALVDMEGTFVRGVGDRTRRAEIELLPGAVEKADGLLGSDAEALRRLGRVRQLIRGFESPYGMELLATAHWVAVNEGAKTKEAATMAVQSWSARKRARYQPAHIAKAWRRLQSEDWFEDDASRAVA
jgi:O-acetyl-ADP-ribose deacetylase (regulator of RNase III)